MKKYLMLVLPVLSLSACSPTVKLEAPDKPIQINLNINIEQHVKISIDKDVKQAISRNKDIF